MSRAASEMEEFGDEDDDGGEDEEDSGEEWEMEDACLMCENAPARVGVFCSRSCSQDAMQHGPILLELPEDHASFESVANQFEQSWKHSVISPRVRRVYKIVGDRASTQRYLAYRNSVEADGNFKRRGLPVGNERRRWHGTSRECRLGDKGRTELCESETCGLCGIIANSYNMAHFGEKTGWGRFGRGIYTSATSSKADDYSENVYGSSRVTAMLLNTVVIGKGYKLYHNEKHRTAPPRGYHSVLGEVGDVLNYDEVVVYDEDAIRPSWLVIYGY